MSKTTRTLTADDTRATVHRLYPDVHGLALADDAMVTVVDLRPQVYTVAEVQAMLGLSRGTTYAMLRAGEIPALQLGARWVIPRNRFHAWLDGCTKEAITPAVQLQRSASDRAGWR